jgi:hypothetical protein
MAAIDISYDATRFDNTEAVTLTLKRNAGNTEVAIAAALRGRTSRSEPGRLGALLMTDFLSFHLPATQVGSSNTVEEGDTVTDGDSTIYTITDVRRVESGDIVSGYRCSVTPQRTDV